MYKTQGKHLSVDNEGEKKNLERCVINNIKN